jgi:hypothetical protein
MPSIFREAAAVTAALAAVSGYVVMSWLDFYGPSAPSWTGVVVGVLATALGVGVALALGRHLATSMLLLLALSFCGLFIHNAAEARVLAVRGVSANCRVDDIQKTSRTVHNGSVEDGTTTVTMYTYRLRCPSGGPTEMRTKAAAARLGTVLALTWDPRHRVAPRPNFDVPHGSDLILPSAAVLVVVLLAATADPAAFHRRL